MEYFVLKWAHILSAAILFGATLGTALSLFAANRANEVANIVFAARFVVIANWLFTTPAIIIQFLSGAALIRTAGYAWRDFWIVVALGLYCFLGLCWLVVAWMQIKMRDIAQEALRANAPLPKRYWRLDAGWILIGTVTFPTVVAIFWLMIRRPI